MRRLRWFLADIVRIGAVIGAFGSRFAALHLCNGTEKIFGFDRAYAVETKIVGIGANREGIASRLLVYLERP
ncbi:MAG TPA: hypothetical protein VLE51_03535 [Candidatus Saccharimonadales bacterium]|nr:hypothetical protein [Candidatus Saccharimonadales bacterium]